MTKYVIIGSSAAGISACEAIREKDKKGEILLVSKDRLPLYSRCLLTYLIGGKIDKEKIFFKDKDFYKKNDIEALHGVTALKIDTKKKVVALDNKRKVRFDRLLIATGASSKSLEIPGEEKKGVFGLRNVEDADGIISMLDNADTAVILGGGLIGLRDAYALRLRQKKVKVVVKSSFILSQMLDRDAAEIIEEKLTGEGIEIIKGLAATKINGENGVSGVLLDDGTELSCQMIIIGKGVTPNIEIAKESFIKTETGIVTDGRLETSVKDVYAAGDVAQTKDITTGTAGINAIWPAAVEEGRVAGYNMAGAAALYDGSAMMNSTDFFGLATISIGLTRPKQDGYEELKFIDKKRRLYKKVVLKDNVICGVILVNNVANAGVYGILIKKRIDISLIKDSLLRDNFDYAKILPLIKERPDKFGDMEVDYV